MSLYPHRVKSVRPSVRPYVVFFQNYICRYDDDDDNTFSFFFLSTFTYIHLSIILYLLKKKETEKKKLINPLPPFFGGLSHS